MKAEKSVSIEISVAVSRSFLSIFDYFLFRIIQSLLFSQPCLASFALLVIRLDFPKDAEKCIGCQLVKNVVDPCARIVVRRTEATVSM